MIETPADKFTIIISANSLNELQRCAKNYEYYKIRHLGQVGPKDEKLERGDLIHQVLDFFYKAIIAKGGYDEHIEDSITFGRYVATTMDLEIEATEYFLSTCRDYLHYSKSYNWTPLHSEQPFSLVLFEDEELRIILEGKIDLIFSIPNGTIFWADHKSVEKSSEPSPLANQFMGYGYAFKDITRFGMVNQVGLQKTLPPEKKFKTYTLTYDIKGELLEEWREETIFAVKQLHQYIKMDYFPRNHASCMFCRYKKICEKPPNLREEMIASAYTESKPFDLFAK